MSNLFGIDRRINFSKWVASVASAALALGCGGSSDNGPTVLGFSPSVRAEMREAIAESDQAADADAMVEKYMSRARELAGELKVQPTAAGDYPYPEEQEKMLEEWKKGDFMEVARDFDLALPKWAEPLKEEYESGTISPVRRELLTNVVIFELVDGLSK